MITTNIGDALFTKTQQKVLSLLFGKPQQSFYTNEIVRWADMGRGTVRRELDRLVVSGLIVMHKAGNQHHYQANPSCPIYPELLGIVKKTFGITGVIQAALTPLESDIELAFIYGSIPKGEETATSDIDLLVIADSLEYADLMALLTEAEQSLSRMINPSIYTKEQVVTKLKQKNAFLTRLMEQPKLWVKGSEDDIKEIG